jgi:hypothetical protein
MSAQPADSIELYEVIHLGGEAGRGSADWVAVTPTPGSRAILPLPARPREELAGRERESGAWPPYSRACVVLLERAGDEVGQALDRDSVTLHMNLLAVARDRDVDRSSSVCTPPADPCGEGPDGVRGLHKRYQRCGVRADCKDCFQAAEGGEAVSQPLLL